MKSAEKVNGGRRRSLAVPGSLLIGLLVSVGMLVRFWAWAEISIRIWLFHFIILASGDLLGPSLHFTNLYYRFPLTVILEAPELEESGKTFLSAQRMRLTLERIPVAGRAVEISEVRFYRPVLRFRWRDDGGLVGLNTDFIKSLEGEEYSDTISTNPSDFLAIRVIQIVKGSLQFESPGEETVHLDDISLQFDATPRAGYPGLYRLDASVERAPVLSLDLEGSLNIDTGNCMIENFKGMMKVDPTRVESLPKDIQGIVDHYRLIGSLGLRASGMVPLVDLARSDLDIELQLENSSSVVYGYLIPIPKLVADLHLKDRSTVLNHMILHMPRGGHVSMTGNLDFDPPRKFDVQFDIIDLQVEGLLSQMDAGHPRYSGLIGATGEVSSQVEDVMDHLAGHGVVNLSRGDILNVPIVSGLQDAVLGKEDWPLGNDEGSMVFTMEHNRVLFDDLELEGDHLAVRGEGELYFDSKVNFRFNAGPLEKLQMNLGGVGDVLGFLTDRIVTYQVHGTWDDPRFSGRILGLGTEHRTPQASP